MIYYDGLAISNRGDYQRAFALRNENHSTPSLQKSAYAKARKGTKNGRTGQFNAPHGDSYFSLVAHAVRNAVRDEKNMVVFEKPIGWINGKKTHKAQLQGDYKTGYYLVIKKD